MPITHRYSRFPAFSWSIRSDRTTRTIAAIAAAALIGTVVGGLSAFAVVSALTAPPRQDLAAATANTPTPIRTFDAAVPDPSAGMTAGPPVLAHPIAPAQTDASAQPAAQPPTVPPGPGPQLTWPDALSRAHAAMPPAPEAAIVPLPPAQQAPGAAKPASVMAPNVVRVPNDANADAPGQFTKKRASLTHRTAQPAVAQSREATRQASRPLYDHFWGHAVREPAARPPTRRADPGGGNDDRND